jgi:hypothetical protein
VTPGLHSGPQSWSVDQCPETPPEHPESSVPDAMRKSVVTRNYPPNNSRGYLQMDPRLSSVWPRCCLEAGDTAARISLLRKNWPCLVRGLLFVIDIHIVRARRAVNLGFAEPSGAGDKVVSERRRPASNNRGYAMHGQWLPSARAGERHSVSGTVS